jgi:hypothetical protein
MDKKILHLAATSAQNNGSGPLGIATALLKVKEELVARGIGKKIVDDAFQAALGAESMCDMLQGENRIAFERSAIRMGIPLHL